VIVLVEQLEPLLRGPKYRKPLINNKRALKGDNLNSLYCAIMWVVGIRVWDLTNNIIHIYMIGFSMSTKWKGTETLKISFKYEDVDTDPLRKDSVMSWTLRLPRDQYVA
jgi:hypothetical protein